MDLDLRDHVVVVTGGASGIGEACALRFAAEGARVAIWDLADTTVSAGEIYLTCDVTDHSAVNAAADRTESQLGPIDCFVHAAAIGSGAFGHPFTNVPLGNWQRVLDVNIMGMANVAYVVGPRMQTRQSGSMTFLASVAGQIGSQTDPPYSASKAANINFSQCLAKDLAAAGVRVNTVCPGMVETPLTRRIWQAWHDSQPKDAQKSYPEWAEEKLRRMVPLGRWQTAEDIADLIVFLSSARASQITGQTINVDGGFVMHS